MSIVHGTPKGGVWKFCLTEKFWLLKHFNDEYLLNKKLEFISECRRENKLPIEISRKGVSCICTLIDVSFLVFVTKYFVFYFLEN